MRLALTRLASVVIGVVGWALLQLLLRAWSWIVDWARDALWRVVDIKVLINHSWDWLNLSAKLLLNIVKVEAILPVNEVDGETEVSKTSGTTNAMQVGLGVLWEIEVDNDVDSLDINTAGKQIRANKVTANTVAEIVENAVTSGLKHACVTVKARVTQLGDLLGEKLHAVGRVAKNNGLVDLKLGEEGIQAVDFLLLFNKGVVLRDTTERKLVHEVDFVWVGHVFDGKCLNRSWESGGEQHDLAIFWVELEEILDNGREFGREKLVSLIHNEHGALAEISDTFSGEILDSSWSADNNVNWLCQTNDVVAQASSTGSDHNIYAKVLSQGLAHLRCLERKLTGWDENETLNLVVLWVDTFEGWDDESGGLPGSVLCASEDIAAGQCDWNRLFLNR